MMAVLVMTRRRKRHVKSSISSNAIVGVFIGNMHKRCEWKVRGNVGMRQSQFFKYPVGPHTWPSVRIQRQIILYVSFACKALINVQFQSLIASTRDTAIGQLWRSIQWTIVWVDPATRKLFMTKTLTRFSRFYPYHSRTRQLGILHATGRSKCRLI